MATVYSKSTSIISFMACGLLACAVASAHPDDELPGAVAAKIDAIAKAWVEAGKSAGVAVGVARDGQVVFARGYGYANLDDKVPVTPDTVFRAGSIQKQFTAAAVLLLAERGKLSLDDSLAKYFPDIPQSQAASIRQLLNHTAGLHNLSDGAGADPQVLRQLRLGLSQAEILELIKSLNPLYDFAPGTAFHYSNTGYMLAGMIVEKVSGQSLRDFLQANIFSKHGMASTAVDNDHDIVPHRAQGYDRAPGRPGAFQHTAFFSMHAAQWSGGLRTTVGDLLRWQQALLSGRVIGQKLLREMTSPARLRDGRRTSEGVWPPGERARGDYGYGLYFLEIAGHKQIIHGGGVNGFGAVASTSVDDQLSFVVLTNTTEGLSSPDGEVWIKIAQALLSNQKARKP